MTEEAEADITQKLAQFLREGQSWEKKPTNVEGVFLLKLPTFKSTPPSIAIEVNPVIGTSGARKKRGIIIRSGSELDLISQLLSNPKVVELAKKIQAVNPQLKEGITRTGDTDVFEI